MSPFPFSLVVWGLHVAFLRVIGQGRFSGISFEAYDFAWIFIYFTLMMLFYGRLEDSNVHSIVRVLYCFFLALGLKINISKSFLLGIGVL